jgi:hypothetical protein
MNNDNLKSAGFNEVKPLPKDETATAPVGTPIYQAQKEKAKQINTILSRKISAAKKYARPSELEALKVFEDGISDAMQRLEYGRLPVIERQYKERYEPGDNAQEKELTAEEKLNAYRAAQRAKDKK